MSGKSPEWLPPGFTVKIKYKKGRKIKYYFNVATGEEYHSKKEVLHRTTEDNSFLVTPKSEKGDGNGHSSIDKVDVVSDKTNDSAAWLLPNGWTVEERRKKTGSVYKIYIDPSSGNKFYSKPAVTRYLNTIDHADTLTSQNKSNNAVEPLPDRSLQVLPMTNTGSIRGKKRKGNSLVTIDNMDEPVPEKSPQVISMANTGGDHGQKRKGKSRVKIDNVDEPVSENSPHVISMATTGSDHGQKRRGRSRGKIDSVDEPVPEKSPQVISMVSTGGDHGQKRRGRSRVKIDSVDEPVPEKSPHVISMANTDGDHEQRRRGRSRGKIDSVDEPVPEKSPQVISMENTGGNLGQKRKEKSRVKIDTVVEPFPAMSPQVISTTNTDGIHEKKRNDGSFVTVSIERKTADGLPSGWTKEIRITHSGDRTRKDPFYIDPVSGYIFRSKPDALRYLQTNDIRSCILKPQKKELDEVKLIKNKIPSSDPAKEKLSMDNKKKAGSTKSKKRKDSSLPSRSSKRLAGSEPEIQSPLNLSEHTLRAALKVITASEVDASPSFPHKASDSIPQAFNIEPAKEAADDAVVVEETPQDVNQLKEVEKPPTESSAIPEEPSGEKAGEKPLDDEKANEKPLDDTKASEKPLDDTKASEKPLDDKKVSEKPLDDGRRSQESQLCYDFGDSWSDPLEFALKTLRGELPIEDNLTFPSCFGEQLNTSFNQIDGCLKHSQFAAPTNIQSEFASHSESSKKNNTVDPLPASSPLFSPLQNAVNPLPASAPSFSALGNIGFSSCGGFNLQPSTEVGKKDSKTKFNP
ncbi:methyl-CPG-binding domain protein 13 [Perilla frutescens var. frutescens]|nr:methyl-CPG-binding domain protein 13 [Perilla frutescens var. frutescens]